MAEVDLISEDTQVVYKNIFPDEQKDAEYKDLGAFLDPRTSSSFCSANEKFALIHLAGGGGKLFLAQQNKFGRYAQTNLLKLGQKPIWSEFSPFNPNMFALASVGGGVAIYQIDDDMFNEEGRFDDRKLEPIVEIDTGSNKDATIVRWNPCVANILAIAGKAKKTTNLWCYDITSLQCLSAITTGHEIFHMDWDFNGNNVIWSSKGGPKEPSQVFMMDPRSADNWTEDSCVCKIKEARDCYVFYCDLKHKGGATNYIGISGRTTKECCIWFYDLEKQKLKRHIKHDAYKKSLVPCWDAGRNLLFSYSKATQRVTIHFFILKDGCIDFSKSKSKPVSALNLKTASQGGCFMGQYGLDYGNVEIQRFFSLDSDSKRCRVFKLICPRLVKGDFNSDFYPEVRGKVSALDTTEWTEGTNAQAVMWSLDPSIERDETGASVFVKKMTYGELEKENKALKEWVRSLLGDVDEESLQTMATEKGVSSL